MSILDSIRETLIPPYKQHVIESPIDEKTTICSICCDSYETSNECVITNCNHIYHKMCIETWLKNNKSCPVCRTRLEHEYPTLQIGESRIGLLPYHEIRTADSGWTDDSWHCDGRNLQNTIVVQLTINGVARYADDDGLLINHVYSGEHRRQFAQIGHEYF